MTLQEAMLTNCFFKRPTWVDKKICWYKAGTGPFRYTVTCDYFAIDEDSSLDLNTSLDLYADEIFANDFEVAGF